MKFPYRFTSLYSYKIPRIDIIKTLIHSLYSLQVESASSEPSGHSGSPSHLHRAGTHCPFLHAKSVVEHVFFAVQKKEKKKKKEGKYRGIHIYTRGFGVNQSLFEVKGQFGCTCFFKCQA